MVSPEYADKKLGRYAPNLREANPIPMLDRNRNE